MWCSFLSPPLSTDSIGHAKIRRTIWDSFSQLNFLPSSIECRKRGAATHFVFIGICCIIYGSVRQELLKEHKKDGTYSLDLWVLYVELRRVHWVECLKGGECVIHSSALNLFESIKFSLSFYVEAIRHICLRLVIFLYRLKMYMDAKLNVFIFSVILGELVYATRFGMLENRVPNIWEWNQGNWAPDME